MTDAQFEKALTTLRELPFREDVEAALQDLYKNAAPAQRVSLRHACKQDNLCGSKPWRNPADYDRSDLTREQRMRQRLLAMSIQDGGKDYRDDLMSIAYCYHNLTLLGVDADGELEELATMSAPNFANLLLNFVRRIPQEKSMKSFGLKMKHTPQGPTAEFSP